MAGEIIKGTVIANIHAVNGQSVGVVGDVNGQFNLNEIAAFNYDTHTSKVLTLLNGTAGLGDNIDGTTVKLAVEQGKKFETTQVTFDAAVPSSNIVAIINDAINVWTVTNGPRYDDFILNVNPSGANHDITIVIIRYY